MRALAATWAAIAATTAAAPASAPAEPKAPGPLSSAAAAPTRSAAWIARLVAPTSARVEHKAPGPLSSAPTRGAAWIARLVADTPAWSGPRAEGSPRMLAPLSPATGGPVGLLVLEVRDDWLRVLLPERPNGRSAWVNARRVRLSRTRWRVEVDRSARLVRVLRGGRTVRRFRAVVGAPGTPTPVGRFAVAEFAREPDPDGFLGPYALHLTAHSEVLDDYGGGPGRVAIHGRGGASLADPLGSARSHGCVRVSNAAVRFLARRLVPGVPVAVIS
ncbi:L,D-transpeptidase [Solirubrobacter phytolaccae]|uniref:L,D-transpeptidase n=1 Tax=Solirubrobacter phytolaccae TaxID=1404360 RepID=A0A9X3S7N6_9ACTN|nr:L,D-transpeptidase [Solirubrobacter phytolaccae]MDA0181219.1 L,D-transpeptidase [Solirubrobacter phytolaccae]